MLLTVCTCRCKLKLASSLKNRSLSLLQGTFHHDERRGTRRVSCFYRLPVGCKGCQATLKDMQVGYIVIKAPEKEGMSPGKVQQHSSIPF